MGSAMSSYREEDYKDGDSLVRFPRTKIERLGLLLALVAGMALAGGLVYAGMTQPKRVIAFLDVSTMTQGTFPGRWNPRVGITLASAAAVMLVAFWFTTNPGRKPWFAQKFRLPNRTSIDFRLVMGSALFGIGWGLSGYDPATSLASVLTGSVDAVIFVAMMFLGMLAAIRFSRSS